jgi:hypothetical protein
MSTEKWKALQAGMDAKWPQPKYMTDDPQPDRSHTAYRDETYITITRWTAQTKIVYKPHAKAPGSKSHVRYEKYSRARTVEEALKLGSWPADWCWDYERGFIKVVGGRIREEPIDPSMVDTSELDDVDKILSAWFIREAARMLGMSLQQLRENSDSKDQLLLRMRRTVAEKKAKDILESCKMVPRSVSDSDVLDVLRSWGFKKNVTRLNVAPEGHSFVFSDTMGLVSDRTGHIIATKYTLAYPTVAKVLTQYVSDHAPKEVGTFPFTSININKNYAGRRHRDGNNVGPSLIKAFGSFTGGLLKYFPDDNRSTAVEELDVADAKALDVGKNLVLFDGKRGHQVENFKGERYSLVYFTCPRSQKANAATQSGLRKCGFNLPTVKAQTKALSLLAPPGSKKGGAKFKAWPIASKFAKKSQR